MEKNEAFRFIQEVAARPEWLAKIRGADPEGIAAFAKDNGYKCSYEEMRDVSREVLKGAPDKEVSRSEIEEAESASVGAGEEGGYGSDSGFALISGVAAEILKKEGSS